MTAMVKLARNLILSSVMAFSVVGCDGDFIHVCMNCFEHDAERPLSYAQAQSIIVDAPVKSLPKEAHNVYFKEWCGIDCTQIFRFDLPTDTAHDVMRRFSKVEIQELPKHDQRGLLRAQMEDPPLGWWLREAVPKAEGVATDVNIGQLTEFILVPDGRVTRVYMRAFDM